MPEGAVHVASGKVREIFELDDERLLLVASDRISVFDVVLPDRDSRQGTSPHGPVRVLVRADTRDRPEPSSRAAPRRSLDRGSRRCRCCRSSASCAATWPAPAGRSIGASGTTSRPRAAGGAARVGATARADLHAGDEGADGPRREHLLRAGGASSSATELLAGARAARLELYATAAEHARGAASSSPTRSSSSGSTPTAARADRRGADARLVPLLAGGRSTRRAAPSRHSTSSTCATTARRSAGTRARRARAAGRRRRRHTRAGTSRRSSESTGISSRRTSRIRAGRSR